MKNVRERYVRIVLGSSLCGAIIAATAATATAGAPTPFTEEAAARGVSYVTAYPFGGHQTFGAGVALVDLNNNGLPDLVAVGKANGQIGIWENLGNGMFADRSGTSGIPSMVHSSGVTAADYDNDGDLDLYISVWLGPDKLLRNDGNFVFTDVTIASGMGGDTGAGCGLAWADYNGDGYLDLYVANRTGDNGSTSRNKLYRNNGDGTFTEVAVSLGVDRGSDPTLNVVWFDYDGDNLPDLYLSTDKGAFGPFQNWMFKNNGDGTFTETSAASGTNVSLDSMGCAVGDFNRNGHPDLYCTNIPVGHALLTNQGDGTFVREDVSAGVTAYEVGWGAHFFDYDNDAWNELYVCQMGAPNLLYDHNGVWPCDEIGAAMGVAGAPLASSFGMAVADIDGDGDLDLVVQTDGANLRVYMNHEGQKRNWAMFRMVGTGANRYSVGGKVRIRTDAVWQVTYCAAGANWKSQNDYVMHFGLDQATTMDEIVATWPNGDTRTLTNYPALTTWTLYHDERLGDFNGDLIVDLDDFIALQDYYGAPVAPGGEMFDLNGDGMVDEDDYQLFLARYTGPLNDCNNNGVHDLDDIILGTSTDADRDGVPDDCFPPVGCDGDADGNFIVNLDDVTYVVLRLGTMGSDGDVDGNNQVNIDDLTYVVLRLGNSCL